MKDPADSPTVLVISHDWVGPQMAGPGIRYLHLARVLAQEFEVVLAVPAGAAPFSEPHLAVLPYHSGDDAQLTQLIAQARAVVAPSLLVASVPALLTSPVPLAVDGYNPLLAEALFFADETEELLSTLTPAYLRGDCFLCASERQRDWWLGLLEAHGRINRWTFAEDRSLRHLVDVVPFGLPDTPFPAAGARPDIPGLADDERVLLWGGGLWDWLDPLTAVRALPAVLARQPRVRLLFPGTRHPNPAVRPMRNVTAAQELTRDLGLAERHVLFGDWVPQEAWPSYLCRADVGLSLHLDSLETRLAFRGRLLDYIWAGVPIVATRGDETSALVERYQLGAVVDYADEQQVAAAILQLLERPREAWRPALERARQELTWERAAQPLLAFCRQPRCAPDRVALGTSLGNPFYVRQIDRLTSLVQGYEQGRFIRLMRRIGHLRGRL